MEQVQDSVAAVPHQHQWPAGQPSAELQDHLAGPLQVNSPNSRWAMPR